MRQFCIYYLHRSSEGKSYDFRMCVCLLLYFLAFAFVPGCVQFAKKEKYILYLICFCVWLFFLAFASEGCAYQDMAMQLSRYLTCENYQEACMLLTAMGVYFLYCCMFASASLFLFIMLQFTIFHWSVILRAILKLN